MPELSKEELEELAEKAAAHASALTGQHAAREVGKEVGKRMEEATGHHSPISSHCEDILGTPTPVWDFRGARSWVMCRAWQLQEQGQSPRLQVGRAWQDLRKVAPTTRPTTPEEKKKAMEKLCSLEYMDQIPKCEPYTKEEKASEKAAAGAAGG